MKLVIISHTPHYRKEDRIVGWGATVREINYLAKLFKEVVHIAPLHDEKAPASSLPYETPTIIFKPVPSSVGKGLLHYLDLLLKIPVYARVILGELKQTDVVHVRCPAAISLIAVLLLFFVQKPKIRWIKYAGNWKPEGGDPWSYKFQCWWLEKKFHKSIVTINGKWPHQLPHVHSFLNPCLTTEELKEAETLSRDKKLSEPLRLLFVGRLETEKGVGRCLEIASELLRRKVSFFFDFAGDGLERKKFEAIARDFKIDRNIKFHSWLSRDELNKIYEQAHFLILPSQTEGWPKVISEAMAYGVVPLASKTGSIPDFLRGIGIGGTFDPDLPMDFSDALCGYLLNREKWKKESSTAVNEAKVFSYKNYLKAVEQLLFKGVTL